MTVVLCLCVMTQQAWADNTTPYSANEPLELSLAVGVLAGSVLLPMLSEPDELSAPACGACDPLSVNALDRPVTGYNSSVARHVSDITVATLVVSPFLLSGLDVGMDETSDGLSGFMTDTTVLASTLALNIFLTQTVKFAVQRPRPFTYNPDVDQERKLAPDSRLSFYSGHTSTAFSMAVAYGVTYSRRHPDDWKRFLVWGGGLTLATATGGLRIAGGKHFWTDVMVGAAVGSALGVAVPALHFRGESHQGQVSAGVSQGVTSLVYQGSF